MFTRVFSCQTSISKDALRSRLIGNHMNIHDLDFEIQEKNENLRIIPHAEQLDEIKALPITYVELREDAGKTRVKITSRMRKLDTGAPMLLMILCSVLVMASGTLLLLGERIASIFVLLLSVIIYGAFRMNLEKSYFDYVKKIRSYIVDECHVI